MIRIAHVREVAEICDTLRSIFIITCHSRFQIKTTTQSILQGNFLNGANAMISQLSVKLNYENALQSISKNTKPDW